MGKINMNKTWIEWTEIKPEEKLKYRSREYRKDIPHDQEKLMTRIIYSMDSYNEEKDQNNDK
jgi:hypothetical protein